MTGAGVALAGAVLAWWLRSTRRPERDKHALRIYALALSRGAFRGPFNWRSGPQEWAEFADAISHTIGVFGTGRWISSDGSEIRRTKPLSEFRNREWARALQDVTDRLRMMESAARNIRTDSDRQRMALYFDQERDAVIAAFNEVLRRAGLRKKQLGLPTASTNRDGSLMSWEDAFPQ